MPEYLLQKRTLSHWSYVTWYEDLEVAQLNFQRASKDGNGYSWRLVELTVVDQKLLDGERQPEPDGEDAETPGEANPTEQAVQPFKSSWGVPSTDFKNGSLDIKPTATHGLAGSVWMVHFGLKRKTRVPLAEMESLIAQGYVKGSPRTVL